MNNKVIIAIVAVLAIGAGVWFFLLRGGAPVLPGQKVTNPETLAAAIAAGQPLKCSISPTEENGNMTGTFYVANGKTRGDFTGTIEGTYNGGHMIIDDKTSYTWFDGQTTGFKLTSNDVEVEPGEEQPLPTAQGFDPNEEMGFACEGWVPDQTKFVIPSAIQFTEMGLGAGSLWEPSSEADTGAAAAGTAAQCAACDSLSGDIKAQCKTSLGCK